MIITRTPFRISFFGGGTDYPAYYREHGGAVLSTTINKYCYISCRYLPPFFDYKYRIRYTHREEVQTIEEIAHPSVRECIKFMHISKGIEMVHTSDIPARSGIGSSSAFTVGFLNALNALVGKMSTKRQLTRDAIHVEQDLIKEHVGSQDQAAVAFGGLNKIEFGNGRDFYVSPVTIAQEKINLLHSHLMLFYSGLVRTASVIAQEQINNTPNNTQQLNSMKEMVNEAVSILNSDNIPLNDFGKLLHEAWMLKKGLTKSITNGNIDDIYSTGIAAGASGGKLLGAGGGGFVLFFVKPELQQKVKEALRDLLHVPFYFENLGSQIVLYSTQEEYSQ